MQNKILVEITKEAIKTARIQAERDRQQAEQQRQAAIQERVNSAVERLTRNVSNVFGVPQNTIAVTGYATPDEELIAYVMVGDIPLVLGADTIRNELVVPYTEPRGDSPLVGRTQQHTVHTPDDLAWVYEQVAAGTILPYKPDEITWDGELENYVWADRLGRLEAWDDQQKAEREARAAADRAEAADRDRRSNPARAMLAGHALQGMIASNDDTWGDSDVMVRQAVLFADKLLDELDK